MNILDRYQEALAPLRMADRNLVGEAIAMLHGISTTTSLLATTIESLLEIEDDPRSFH